MAVVPVSAALADIEAVLVRLPRWIPAKLMPGTPSMLAGNRMPCQWTEVMCL